MLVLDFSSVSSSHLDHRQKKAFYRQIILESSCVRKETFDIDILVTSSNGERKIMQSIRIACRPPLRKRSRTN